MNTDIVALSKEKDGNLQQSKFTRIMQMFSVSST